MKAFEQSTFLDMFGPYKTIEPVLGQHLVYTAAAPVEGTESTPFYPPFPAAISRVRVHFGTAPTSDASVEFRINDRAVVTATVTAGLNRSRFEIPHNGSRWGETDKLTIVPTTLGGGSQMTVDVQFGQYREAP